MSGPTVYGTASAPCLDGDGVRLHTAAPGTFVRPPVYGRCADYTLFGPNRLECIVQRRTHDPCAQTHARLQDEILRLRAEHHASIRELQNHRERVTMMCEMLYAKYEGVSRQVKLLLPLLQSSIPAHPVAS